MQKILHIFPKTVFTGNFVKFINDNFSKKEHLFLVAGKNNKYGDLSDYDNILDFNKFGNFEKMIRIYKLVKQSDKIIFHSLFGYKLAFLVVIFSKLTFKKKTKLYWDIWGGDLYNDYLKSNLDIKNKIRLFFKKIIIRSLDGLLGLEGDVSLARKWFRANGRHFYAFYPNLIKYTILDNIKTQRLVKKTPKILLGNSASFTNNHFEVIDILERKNGDNFEVICPLSYGDNDYGKKVINYGKSKLNSKFKPITIFLEPKEYAKLLNSVDVAIMFHDRQQAFGNILSLLYLGKKVFVKSEVSTYKWLNDKLGIKLFDANEIKKMSIGELLEFDYQIAEHNKNIVNDFFSERNCKKIWENIFES